MVCGARGTLEVFYKPDTVALRRAGDASYVQVKLDPDLTSQDPWARLHRELREAIEKDAEPSVSGVDGLRNIEWALSAYLAGEKRAKRLELCAGAAPDDHVNKRRCDHCAARNRGKSDAIVGRRAENDHLSRQADLRQAFGIAGDPDQPPGDPARAWRI